MTGAWLAVASADHVRLGRTGGFMQVSHGKDGPLRRIRVGDRIAYYSPTVAFGGKTPCRSFTAIGIVADGEPYLNDMGGGFHPWRRNVDWLASVDVPIATLLDQLDFSAGARNWGYKLRFGLLAISEYDVKLIREAMTSISAVSMPA